MSSYENGISLIDLKKQSNGLHKSSSLPLYKSDLNNSSNNYLHLPIINYNNQTKMVSDELDRRNRIKDETLLTKKKLLKYRGLPEKYENNFSDSWYDFQKRREKEKQRKRMHNLIRGEHVIDTDSDNDIFRNLDNSLPSKMEDKRKLKQYLPIKKDLEKLMMRINYNMQKKVDNNSYILNKNLSILEKGYDELRMMIIDKMDKLEKKQRQDFYNLNQYIKIKEKQNRNKSMDNIIENGGSRYIYNNHNDYNNRYNYRYKEKERQENIELAQRIKNIPNLLDNMVNEIGQMKERRNKQKLNFLYNLDNSLSKELKDESNYDISDRNEEKDLDYDYDEYENKDEVNDLKFYNYNYKNNIKNKDNNRYDNLYSNDYDYNNNYNNNKYYYIKRKSRTEELDRKSTNKSFISMSKSSIQKLKKDLKPLSYQNIKHIKPKKINKKEDTTFISGNELLKIYQEKNKNKKISLPKIKNNNQQNKSNIKENSKENKSIKTNNNNNNENNNNTQNKTITKLKESKIIKTESKQKENNTKEKSKKEENEDDEIVVSDDDEEEQKKSNDNKDNKENNENKKNETENDNENKNKENEKNNENKNNEKENNKENKNNENKNNENKNKNKNNTDNKDDDKNKNKDKTEKEKDNEESEDEDEEEEEEDDEEEEEEEDDDDDDKKD